jgi:hypothetical protein
MDSNKIVLNEARSEFINLKFRVLHSPYSPSSAVVVSHDDHPDKKTVTKSSLERASREAQLLKVATQVVLARLKGTIS